MNLREFIGTRQCCPMCNSNLTVNFISGRAQKATLSDNELSVRLTMKSLKGHVPDYQVSYNFDLDNNSFYVNFHTEWDHTLQVPMHLIEKFREFHKNLKNYKFILNCEECERYALHSELLVMNMSNAQTSTIEIETENFTWAVPAQDDCKIIGMFNNSKLSRTELVCWRGNTEEDARLHWLMWTGRPVHILPPIPFVSKEETLKRLDKLLTFS